MNRALFAIADFLSRPPGFYWMLLAMLVCSVAALVVDENVITFGLSVLAIVITGVVLIQGYRDTAAIQAKLDELIVATTSARNELVGLEKEEPEKIAAKVETLEQEAKEKDDALEVRQAGPLHGSRSPRSQVRKARRDRSKDG